VDAGSGAGIYTLPAVPSSSAAGGRPACVAQATGSADALDTLDADESIRRLHAANNAPPEILTDLEQVAAMRSYRAEVGGKPLRIVRGEFHRHTEISSDGAGDGTIFDMWRYGLDMAALDWIGSGDHDNGGGREFSWWFTQKTTSIFNVPSAFTSMFTYERSCNYPDGHRNAVFAKRGIRPLARLRGGAS